MKSSELSGLVDTGTVEQPAVEDLRINLDDLLGELVDTSAEDRVRDLLWNEHLECCGNAVVGGEYMGSQEMICCGNPEPSMLNDAQIVASLRALFPERPCPECGGSGEHVYNDHNNDPAWDYAVPCATCAGAAS